MLALARLQGGGVHSATGSITIAIQLSPRNEEYLLNLAQIDLAGKKWDDATHTAQPPRRQSNPQIAQTARKSLADLPTLKKMRCREDRASPDGTGGPRRRPRSGER